MGAGPTFRAAAARALLGALACAVLGGCAHAYIDKDGNRNVIGWVNLTLPPAGPQHKAADWMRVRTVGLALSRTDIGGALELGYSDNTLAVVHNNSCVRLDRLAPYLLSFQGASDGSDSTGR